MQCESPYQAFLPAPVLLDLDILVSLPFFPTLSNAIRFFIFGDPTMVDLGRRGQLLALPTRSQQA